MNEAIKDTKEAEQTEKPYKMYGAYSEADGATLAAFGLDPSAYSDSDMYSVSGCSVIKDEHGRDMRQNHPTLVEFEPGNTNAEIIIAVTESGGTFTVTIDDLDFSNGEVTIGRSSQANIKLPSPIVSSVHAIVSRSSDGSISIRTDSSNSSILKINRNIYPVDSGNQIVTTPEEVAVHEQFTDPQAAIDAMYEFNGATVDRRMGALVATIIEKSDAPKEQIVRNAAELNDILANIDTGLLSSIGIVSSLKLLQEGIVKKDITNTKYFYSEIVTKIGTYISARPNWFTEKMQHDNREGNNAATIARIPEDQLRRVIRSCNSIDGVPVLEYLKMNIN